MSVEEELRVATPGSEFQILNKIPNDLFGLAMYRRNQMAAYPKLQSFLVQLPDEDTQARFAGGRGEKLLPRALFFANYLEMIALRNFGRSDVKYLDYGCGWGRLTRFLLRLTPPENITAVDPKQDVKRYLGGNLLSQRFSVIPEIPISGDIPGRHEIAFLFSIMTHTPPNVNKSIIKALHASLSDNGILMTTIRPKNFWGFTDKFWDGHTQKTLEAQHDAQGYAHMPFSTNPNYGDASYEHQYFVNQFEGFDLLEANYCVVDPFQIMYCFRKK